VANQLLKIFLGQRRRAEKLPDVPDKQEAFVFVPKVEVDVDAYTVQEEDDDDDDFGMLLPSPCPPSPPPDDETEAVVKLKQTRKRKKKKKGKVTPHPKPKPVGKQKSSKTNYVPKACLDTDSYDSSEECETKKTKTNDEKDQDFTDELKATKKKILNGYHTYKESKLTIHNVLLSKSGSSTYKCSECNEIVSNQKKTLRRHVVKHHTSLHVCSHCPMRFGSLLRLNRHQVICEKKKNNPKPPPITKKPCPICGRVCHVYDLKKHMWTHYSEQDKADAVARGEMDPSVRNKNQDRQLFHCDQCFKQFASMGRLEAHFKAVHEEDAAATSPPEKKKKLCGICGEAVKSLSAHMIKHQAYQDRRFSCSICSKRFVFLNQLQRHKNNAHGEQKICEICGKGFKCKKSLGYHMNEHLGLLLPCSHCDKKFSSKGVLTRHVKNVHGISSSNSTGLVQCKNEEQGE